MQLTAALNAGGYEVADFDAHELVTGDDYPDFVVPLAGAVARGEVTWGLAIYGSDADADGDSGPRSARWRYPRPQRGSWFRVGHSRG